MKIKLALFISIFSFFNTIQNVAADEVSKIGVHILNPAELESADKFISIDQTDQWQYVTIPYTLADTEKKKEWQDFFTSAREKKIIPLVRLTTKFEENAWKVPTRQETVLLIDSLAELEWPTDKKHIIIFNEVNHAKEWGGSIDPAEYTSVLRFASNWARSENENFVILPAAMDLAAPNGKVTKEAFAYLEAMRAADADIFAAVDAWNSHSYPNPAFSAAPQKQGQNSLRGFEHELAYLKNKTGRDFEVYITETGWEDNRATSRWLSAYYEYALQHIWSDPQVKAVTPFVLKGAPGPFAGFSFLSGEDQPTKQYTAFRSALHRLYSQDSLAQAKKN